MSYDTCKRKKLNTIMQKLCVNKPQKAIIILLLIGLISIIYVFAIVVPENKWNTKLIAATNDYDELESVLNGKKWYYNINAASSSQSVFWIVNALGGHQKNALQQACLNENYKCVKLLLEYGANPNCRGLGEQYPLNIVLGGQYRSSKLKIAKLLLKNDAKVRNTVYIANKVTAEYSHDLLCMASTYINANAFPRKAQRNIVAIYDLLIKESNNKKPIDETSEEDSLLIAATAGNVELVDYLIENGYADINSTNKQSQNALFFDYDKYSKDAIPEKTVAMIEHLVKKGIDLSITDYYGMRAWDYAVLYGNYDIAKHIEPEDKDAVAEIKDANPIDESETDTVPWNYPYLSFSYKGEKYGNVMNALKQSKIAKNSNIFQCDGYYELRQSKLKDETDRKTENQKNIKKYCEQHFAFDLMNTHFAISERVDMDRMYVADSGCGVKIYHNNSDIYCKMSDLEKVIKYYSDINNYHWYLEYDGSRPVIRMDDSDNSNINYAYYESAQNSNRRNYETQCGLILVSDDNVLQIDEQLMILKDGTGYIYLKNEHNVDLNIDFRKYVPSILEYE